VDCIKKLTTLSNDLFPIDMPLPLLPLVIIKEKIDLCKLPGNATNEEIWSIVFVSCWFLLHILWFCFPSDWSQWVFFVMSVLQHVVWACMWKS